VTEETNPEDAVDWSQLEDAATDGGDLGPRLLTREMLAARILWDVIPCDMVDGVSRYMGLPPSSDDVREMDHEQAHERLAQVGTLAPVMAELAMHATKSVVAGTIYGSHEDSGTPLMELKDREEMNERTFPMIYQSVAAVIAELVDVGILHLPHYGLGAHIKYVQEDESNE
jgi:hypothetical protein